jgi:hypothetical protein
MVSMLGAVPRTYAADDDDLITWCNSLPSGVTVSGSICTVTGSVTMSQNVDVNSGETLVIASTGSLSSGGTWGVYIWSGGTMTVDAGGTVELEQTDYTGMVVAGTMNNYGTITVGMLGDNSFGIVVTGTVYNYGTIDIVPNHFYPTSQGLQIYWGATFINSGTVNVTWDVQLCEEHACPLIGQITSPAPSLLIETRTSGGGAISASVTVSGPDAPSSPVTTNSSGDYFFEGGTLNNGATYSVSATIDGAPLSASVVLGGNSVVVLEPTPSSPPIGSPQFEAFLGPLLVAALLLPVVLVATKRLRRPA